MQTLLPATTPETQFVDITAMKALSVVRWLVSIAAALGLCGSGQVLGAIYVVDQAASESSDTNDGSEERPLKTIQHAADVAKPGDTIFVMSGKYDERIQIRTSGADARPITLRSMPRRSVVVRGFDIQADYIHIDGFEITAEKPTVAVQLAGSHCEVLHNYIYNMMVGVAGTVGKSGPDASRDYSAVSHNRVAYNKVYHSEYGFMLGGNDWLVENNEVNRLFMYAPGNKYDDCDYSRFFGKGCVERFNFYHGSTSSEIRVAHVDCLQTFTVNGEIAQDLTFEYNTCFDFHQMCMVESAPHIGSVRNWTFRGNIVSANSPTMSGGWGPDIIQTPNVTIVNNTISTVRWSAIGLRGQESTNGLIRNNILCNAERALVHGDKDFTPANPMVENNLTFQTASLAAATGIDGKDPLFVDGTKRNFRLRDGSPAVGAGKDGVTIGALESPNVYFVDPQHPAASDEPAWGYPAVPLRSLTKACEVVRPGETIVLRGGVYHETLLPTCDHVTVRALLGEKVIISGADLIDGWTRQVDGSWSAAVTKEPTTVLRDGRSWSDFIYDYHAGQITIKAGGDPRLHVFESPTRTQGIDLRDKKDVKIEGVLVVNTLNAAATTK